MLQREHKIQQVTYTPATIYCNPSTSFVLYGCFCIALFKKCLENSAEFWIHRLIANTFITDFINSYFYWVWIEIDKKYCSKNYLEYALLGIFIAVWNSTLSTLLWLTTFFLSKKADFLAAVLNYGKVVACDTFHIFHKSQVNSNKINTQVQHKKRNNRPALFFMPFNIA